MKIIIEGLMSAERFVELAKWSLVNAEVRLGGRASELYDEAETLRDEIQTAKETYEALCAKMQREHEAEAIEKEAGIKTARIEAHDASERATTVSRAAELL